MATRLRALGRFGRLLSSQRSLLILPTMLLSSQWLRWRSTAMAETSKPQQQVAPQPTESLELFDAEKYEEYIKGNADVVIFYDPERFMDSFQDEILQLVNQISRVKQSKTKARPLKVLRMLKMSPEEQAKFEERYNCYLEFDTILLLRNKYITALSAYGAQEFFDNKEYLVRYFEKMNKLTKKNYDKFMSILKFLPADNTVMLLHVNKSSPNYRSLQRRLAILQLQDTYAKNTNLHWFIIDDFVADKLKFKKQGEGHLYFLLKSSVNNGKQKTFEVDGKHFLVAEAASLASHRLNEVIDINAEKYNQLNVFTARSFGALNPKYQVVLECDLNKLPRHEWKGLVKLEIFDTLKEQLKAKHSDLSIELITVNKALEDGKEKYRVLIRDNQKITDRLNEYQAKTIEEVQSLSTAKEFNAAHSYVYKHEGAATPEGIIKLIEEIRDGKADEYFKSQNPPKARKYSLKLCGKTFKKEILDDQDTCIVFHYSKHCHACKQYGQHYENLALDALKSNDNVKFARMNSDRNDLDCSMNFAYTPVFEIFKDGAKTTPFVYRQQRFTPALLKQFIEITRATTLMKEEEFKQILSLKQYL